MVRHGRDGSGDTRSDLERSGLAGTSRRGSAGRVMKWFGGDWPGRRGPEWNDRARWETARLGEDWQGSAGRDGLGEDRYGWPWIARDRLRHGLAGQARRGSDGPDQARSGEVEVWHDAARSGRRGVIGSGLAGPDVARIGRHELARLGGLWLDGVRFGGPRIGRLGLDRLGVDWIV